MSRIKEEYRQHTLLAAVHEGQCKGRVWKTKELVHEQKGESTETLIEELGSWVDRSISDKAELQGENPEFTSLIVSFQKTLSTLSDNQLAMSKAHYHAADQLATAGDLAEAAGYQSYSGANMQYGFIGKAL